MLILKKLLLRTPDSIGVSLNIARNGALIKLERISGWRTKSEFVVNFCNFAHIFEATSLTKTNLK